MSAARDEPDWIEQRVRDELADALDRAASRPHSSNAASPGALRSGAQEKPGAGSTDRASHGFSTPRGLGPGEAVPPASARPITFNAAMVRAILAGNKTETRRPIKPAPPRVTERRNRPWPAGENGNALQCTLASRGEILWVREPWTHAGTSRGKPRVEFEADLGPAAAKGKAPWRPGRFLPRELSRLELEVRSIWAQRLHTMTPQDAIAEGVSPVLFEEDPAAAVEEFRKMWDEFYGLTDYAWENNPWVWVVRFRSVEPPEE